MLIFTIFRFVKMNEEAKRSMVEWQEKLDKVTKDSETRISELQQKLAKVRSDLLLTELVASGFVGLRPRLTRFSKSLTVNVLLFSPCSQIKRQQSCWKMCGKAKKNYRQNWKSYRFGINCLLTCKRLIVR